MPAAAGKSFVEGPPRVSVAPMMDWTDRHCRYFLRLFAPDVLLYTEMITAQAILRGPRAALLRFSPAEQPVAAQLGGSDPAQLAQAARAAQEAGYCEINLNCGCPSDRVSAGAFGACLMLDPARVADCVHAMRAAVTVPVTVKLRIGVVDRAAEGGGAAAAAAMQRFDERDFAQLSGFMSGCVEAGAGALIVHARKAVLGGFSPHENRTVPPLRFDVVERARQALPGVPVIVNGGLRECAAVLEALHRYDGVMIGREAYHRPWLLAELQQALHPAPQWRPPDAGEVLEHMRAYARAETSQGTPLQAVTRHMLGLMGGRAGARAYRTLMSQQAQRGMPLEELFDRARELCRESDGVD
ncbi:MAG: tRNA dihydrouridine(20/20a) synthase DusA [Steroidobacteraceae bacterium]